MFWAGKAVAYLIGAVSHFCSLVIHFALSRRREFMADAGAVELTGNPEAMISALRKSVLQQCTRGDSRRAARDDVR
jgi:Zn-dependent protease with chaperone function